MSRGLGIVALAALLVAGCGGSSGPTTRPGQSTGSPPAAGFPTLAPPPIQVTGVPANVRVEIPKATSAWIGPAGGVLTAATDDGTTYELAVPELAVREPVVITMTPVTGIDALGLSGGLAGAVFLQPAGLQLAEPATLRIATSRSAPPGTRLVGFDAPDDGAAPAIVPAFADGTTAVIVSVAHFSVPGAAFGSTEDLAVLSSPPTGSLQAYLSALLLLPAPWDGGAKATAQGLIEDAWRQVMQPALANASGDAVLLRAIADWRQFVLMLNLFVHDGDVAAALDAGIEYLQGSGPEIFTVAYLGGLSLLGDRISDAIAGNRTLCDQSHDLEALANLSFWAAVGRRYAPDLRDWESAARGCADIAIKAADLPSTLRNGGSDTIRLQFEMAFADGTKVPVDVEAQLTATGFGFFPAGGTLASAAVPAGQAASLGVTATQDPPYAVGVRACWFLSGIARSLCSQTFNLPFGANSPTPTVGSTNAVPPELTADLPGTYAVTLICANVVFGEGQASVTLADNVVSLSWSVSVSDPGVGAGGLCGDAMRANQLPTSGSYAGTLVPQPNGQIDIVLSSWQVSPCVNPAGPPPVSTAYVPARRAIGIPIGTCVPSSLFGSMGYNTTKVG